MWGAGADVVTGVRWLLWKRNIICLELIPFVRKTHTHIYIYNFSKKETFNISLYSILHLSVGSDILVTTFI